MEGRSEPDPVAVLDEAGARIRAPWAASIAGLLFALFFTAGLVLIRSSPLAAAGDDARVIRLFRDSEDWWLLVGSLYLIPFSGIMFLWFVAVIRDQIGEREDRFFATVFFGSGLLFVSLLFTTAAVVSTPATLVEFLGGAKPSVEGQAILRALGYTLLFALATRAAAVFMVATATIGVRSGVFPRLFALVGYLP